MELSAARFTPKSGYSARKTILGVPLSGQPTSPLVLCLTMWRLGVLSCNDDTTAKAQEFFDGLWNDGIRCHQIDETVLAKWKESHQHRKTVSRRVVQATAQDTAGNISILSEFVRGWIDLGVDEKVAGAGQVFGKKWRGWYIIPDHGYIDDEMMKRLARICGIIADEPNGSIDISKQAPMGTNTALGEILALTSSKFTRTERRMSDRELFVRQEKNYLVHLGLATSPDKKTLILSDYGRRISSAGEMDEIKSIYTDAMDDYVYNGLKLLDFTRRLLLQTEQVSFVEFSFFVRHAWTMDEVGVIASMIKMYRQLPEAKEFGDEMDKLL